jgi:hypothetical protein
MMLAKNIDKSRFQIQKLMVQWRGLFCTLILQVVSFEDKISSSNANWVNSLRKYIRTR